MDWRLVSDVVEFDIDWEDIDDVDSKKMCEGVGLVLKRLRSSMRIECRVLPKVNAGSGRSNDSVFLPPFNAPVPV